MREIREYSLLTLNACLAECAAAYNLLDIHRLLAKAEQENDYVLAIRVSYSALLQMLDKKEVIRWDVSKTNQHYIYEIKNETWSRHFEEISRIFDCVCYGEFPVDETAYRNISRSSGRRWKDETAPKCIDCSFRDRHYGCLHGV